MKTPDEIKKGLECRIRGVNEKCDYRCDECDVYVAEYHLEDRYSDAFTYIKQLETDNESKQKRIDELESRLAQVERERDAAGKIIEDATTYLEDFGSGRFALMQLKKWNGPCPENTKEG